MALDLSGDLTCIFEEAIAVSSRVRRTGRRDKRVEIGAVISSRLVFDPELREAREFFDSYSGYRLVLDELPDGDYIVRGYVAGEDRKREPVRQEIAIDYSTML